MCWLMLWYFCLGFFCGFVFLLNVIILNRFIVRWLKRLKWLKLSWWSKVMNMLFWWFIVIFCVFFWMNLWWELSGVCLVYGLSILCCYVFIMKCGVVRKCLWFWVVLRVNYIVIKCYWFLFIIVWFWVLKVNIVWWKGDKLSVKKWLVVCINCWVVWKRVSYKI